jgi:hypothetical protein
MMNPRRQALVLLSLFAACAAPRAALAADAKTIRENAAASDDSLDNKLTLYFRDALTGLAVSSADVTLDGAAGTTDAGGKVTFAFPKVDQNDDQTVVAEVSKKGYISAKVPLLFRLGMIFDVHYSISPTLPPGALRLVLDWADEPADLDAHLVKQGGFHVSYQDSHDVAGEAKLDHDAKHGYGPETITIAKLDPAATYSYYVRDYTDRGDKTTWKLGQSKAHISLYGETGLVRTFEVPRGQGDVWTVFFFRGGEVVPSSALGGKPADSPR